MSEHLAMDSRTRHQAGQWLAQGQPAIVIEITQVRGSAPRPAGTRMAVSAEHTAGSIGGGHLELRAIQTARAMLQAGKPSSHAHHTEHHALGPSLGQCCGGTVELSYRPLNEATWAAWPLPRPLFHLQLYGAGHVGRAIANVLSTLDVRVDWIDERESEFPCLSPWPSQWQRLCVDTVEAEVRHAPPQACYLVLTHRHDLDQRITEAILRRGDFAYLGLIGSSTKRQRFIQHFERRGLPTEAIAKLTCPIGVEGIMGKQPEVIAVSVVAQLLQHIAMGFEVQATCAKMSSDPPYSQRHEHPIS